MFRAFPLLVAVLLPLAAAAEPFSSRAARDVLPLDGKIAIQVFSHLTPTEKATIQALIPLMAEQMRTPAKFFGSIAYAEDEGLASESLQGAFNFHSPASADAAAIAACGAAAKSGAARCRLAARVVPSGYREGGLSLSQDASAEFVRGFRRAKAPKSLAVSAATGAWAWSESADAAIRDCNARTAGLSDCTVVIQD